MSVKEVPVGQVLEELAGKLKLDLRVDHEALQAAGISLERRVSVNVQDVTVDELLSEVAKAAKLQVRRQGSAVQVGPAK